MFFKLFLLFAVIPVIEIAILVKVGTIIGALPTILLVIATAAIGAYLVRLEGLSIMTRIQKNRSEGIFPAEELMDGALVLVAGAVLLTPGLITDCLGFLLVFPPTRRFFKGFASSFVKGRMVIGKPGGSTSGFGGGFGSYGGPGGGPGFGGFGGAGTGGSPGSRSTRRSVPSYDVEAEVVDEEGDDDSDDTTATESEWENPNDEGKKGGR